MNPIWAMLAAPLGALLGYANPWAQLPLLALLLPASLMLLGRAAPTPKLAFRDAWRAGSLASLALLYWVYWPVQHYGEVHWALALPVPVLLAMAMGCYHGLYGLAAHFSRRLGPLTACVFLSVSWVVMELAQATLLSGFSWLTLASAFVAWPVSVQAAAYVGAYGVSGLLVLCVAGLALLPESRRCALLSLAAAALLLGAGWLRLATDVETAPAHTVAVVQGNIDQSIKWSPDNQRNTVDTYLRLSRQATAQGEPELIVWPETAMPFYFQDKNLLREPVLDFVHAGRAALLLGSPAYAEGTGAGASFVLYNRAYLLAPGGEVMQSYDKEHLVPFGEYMPLASILPLQKLVSGVGDFIPGANSRALENGQLRLGVLICYEAIFASQAQARVEQGANLLVNISNDAWFGDTSAPWQHLEITALRAIEQGRHIVRSTNTGISAFIDPLGRIRIAGPQFQELAATGVVHPRTELTVFHRFHRLLLLAAGGLFAVCIGLVIRSTRPGRPAEHNLGRLSRGA